MLLLAIEHLQTHRHDSQTLQLLDHLRLAPLHSPGDPRDLRGRQAIRDAMLLLFETAAGYALFKVVKEGKLDKAEVRRRGGLEGCRRL